ncbi:MAG: PilZ domain-containing protein [Candidatus Aadella gelida]|nr:PilZ domain-containing protein [Candidatus Aadella gelida]
MKLAKERRRFSRVKDNIVALFQSVEGGMSFETMTKDISQGGLTFITSHSIPKRTEVQFEIQQPLNSDKDLFLPMEAKIQIVWIRKIEDNDEYLIGAKIIEMNKKSQNRIRNYVSNRLKAA